MEKSIDIFTIFKSSDYKENIGVGYLSSFLRTNNINTKIHILNCDDELSEQINFDGRTPFIVGISVYMHIEQYAYEVAKIIKNKYPKSFIFLGGPQVINREEDILNTNQFVDAICSGEGEYAVVDIIDKVYNRKPLSECLGITYRNDRGQLIKTGENKIIENLDLIPFPARDIYEKYPSPYIYVMGSRGCLGHCTFCFDVTSRSKSCKHKVRNRSGKNIANEVEELYNKFKINSFKFLDSTFEDPGEEGIKKARNFYKEITDRNLSIRFCINSRSELVKNYSAEYIYMAKQAGLESIYLGIESGNENDLKLYGKIATIQDNIDAVRLIKNECLDLTFGFINFNPYSTIDKLYKNINFLYNYDLPFSIETLLTFLEVFPQTAISKMIIRDRLLYDNYEYSDLGINFVFQDFKVEKLFEALRALNLTYAVTKIESNMNRDFIYLKKNNLMNCEMENIQFDLLNKASKRKKYTYDFFCECLELSRKDNGRIFDFITTNQFKVFDDIANDLYCKHKSVMLKLLG